MQNESEEKINYQEIKRAFQLYRSMIQEIEVKRANLASEEMIAWGILQKSLSKNRKVFVTGCGHYRDVAYDD